jgi:hypothetical protein
VLRFSFVSTFHSARDSRIKSGFMRLLARQSARLCEEAPFLPIFEGEEAPVRERYAPMHRLLAPDDESFLKGQGLRLAAKNLRREHRRCYFCYLANLTGEVRLGRQFGTLAMASADKWSFRTLLERTVITECSLLYLRWLGIRHAAGVHIAARDIQECLDFLLSEPRFHPAVI